LFLCPDHPQVDLREVLLTGKQSEKEKVWHGPKPAPDEIYALSGIGHIRNMDERDQLIGQLIPGAGTVYFNLPVERGPRTAVNSYDGDMYSAITDRYPRLKPARLSPLLAELRMIKEPLEVDQIRKACAMTGSAFRKALSVIRPGIREYEVEAEIIAEFIRSGAEGHAFDPIIACGENALILHYDENNGECGDGRLLLMDFGAEVNNYATDCTRTVPVSGRFTARQRELYDAVHRVFGEAREMMVPGEKLDDLHQRVGILWQEEHIRLGLYTRQEAGRQDPSEPLWKRYFPHGTSHSIGLDVHDPFDRNVPLQPGMVFSCEPGLYIPEEELGIRLENVILITGKGPEDLMEEIPMDPGEIEQLLR
jgi:Xaa-Pro aminopeptidase